MRIERHPRINVWVREDGCVYLPQNYRSPAHWTFGSRNGRGYLGVKVSNKVYLVHRLVGETFIPNPESKKEIDHINRNKLDNRVENLRWATRSDNLRNTVRNDRVDARGGTHKYEDEKQFYKERGVRYNRTHKNICFSGGKRRWVPNSEAFELLKLPVKERVWL